MTDKPQSLAQRIEDIMNHLPEAIGTGSTLGIFRDLHRAHVDAALLESAWNEEHDERIRLEERLKAAEARADSWERIAKEEKSDDGQAQDPQ